MAELKDIIGILKLVSAAYPNFKMDAQTPDAYLAFLGDLPEDLLKAAVLKTCAESGRQFAPSVGEIRGAAAQLLRKTQGIPSPIFAWDEVCRAPKSGGYWNITDQYTEDGAVIVEVTDYVWSHPLVEELAKRFGWPNFPGDNVELDRAHFFKHYEDAVRAAMQENVELPAVTAYTDQKRITAVQSEILKLANGKRV